MKAFIFVIASLLFAAVVSEEKCCEECTKEGEIKYYALSMEEVFNLGAKYGISVEKRRTFDDGK